MAGLWHRKAAGELIGIKQNKQDFRLQPSAPSLTLTYEPG